MSSDTNERAELAAKIARYRELARTVSDDERTHNGIKELIAEMQARFDALQPD